MPSPAAVRTAVILGVFAGFVVALGCSAPPPPPAAPATEAPLVAVAEAAPDDPRLAFDTPFVNVKPGVKYLGDSACIGCHAAITHAFHAHPMGRSAEFTAASAKLEKYEQPGRNAFEAAGLTHRVERTAAGVVHRAACAGLPGEYAPRADVTLGSGTRGHSFLTVEQGAAWQTPVSWFANLDGWALSPGFDMSYGGRRPVVASCLYCHVNQVEPVGTSGNRFTEPLLKQQAAIGCERCHGPGEAHVAARLDSADHATPDPTIVNPKHLSPALQLDICRQCHLQGQARVARRGRTEFEYRPGLPWDQFVSTFVKHPAVADPHRSVGQFEQMESSACFTKSAGRLTCTSCHDPHEKPKDAVAAYRDRCNACHAEKPCTAPAPERAAKADNCLGCHMPRGDSTTIVHASVTDHRVPRRPGGRAPRGSLPLGEMPVVPYPPGPHAPPEAERERDYGFALMRAVDGQAGGFDPVRELTLQGAQERITRALRAHPGDRELWVAQAAARNAAQDFEGALRAYEQVMGIAAEDETVLNGYATVATILGRHDDALKAADRLVALNPTSADARLVRGTLHLAKRDTPAAKADADAALAIQPLYPRARVLAAIVKHRAGQPTEARADADATLKAVSNAGVRYGLAEWYRQGTTGR